MLVAPLPGRVRARDTQVPAVHPGSEGEIVLAGLRGDRAVRDVCREYEIAELKRKVGQLERALGRKTYELEIAGELSRDWTGVSGWPDPAPSSLPATGRRRLPGSPECPGKRSTGAHAVDRRQPVPAPADWVMSRSWRLLRRIRPTAPGWSLPWPAERWASR